MAKVRKISYSERISKARNVTAGSMSAKYIQKQQEETQAKALLSAVKSENGRLSLDKNIVAQSKGFIDAWDEANYKAKNPDLYEAMGGIKYIEPGTKMGAPLASTATYDYNYATNLSDTTVSETVDRYNSHRSKGQKELKNIIDVLNSGEWQDADTMKKYSDTVNSYANDYITLERLGYFDWVSKEERESNIKMFKVLKETLNNCVNYQQDLKNKMDKAYENYQQVKKHDDYTILEETFNYIGGLDMGDEDARQEYYKAAQEYYATQNISEDDIKNRKKEIKALLNRPYTSKEEKNEIRKELSHLNAVEGQTKDLNTAIEYAMSSIDAGLVGVVNSFSKTANVLVGKPLVTIGQMLGFDIQEQPAIWDGEIQDVNARMSSLGYQSGDKYVIAGNLAVAVTQTLPTILVAWLTGGGSVVASSSSLASTASVATSSSAVTNFSTKAVQTISSLAKNPVYWTSFSMTYGNDYEQAMEYSGNPVIASAFAFVDSAFSAYVEIGSGVENLANDGAKILTNKQKAVKVWESWYEEGGEELIQNNANKLLSWIMYGDGIDSNEELVSYLKELGYESLMGAFAGGLMGAGEMTFQSIVNFRSDTELKSLGNEILNSNNSADIISELKIYFSKSLDAELREIANDIDVNNPDAKLVGALYQSLCRDINTAINSQKTTEGATNGLKMVFNQAGTESKIIYSMATPQYLDTVSQLGVDKATAVDNVFNTIAVVGDNSNIDNSKIKSNRDITEADTEVVQHNDQGGASAEISSVPNNPDRAAPGVVESSDGRQYFDDGSGDEYFGDTDDVGENMSHLTTTEGGASPQGEAFDSSSFDLAEPTQKDIARAPSAQEAIDEAITGKQKTNIQRHILDICKKLFPNITVEFVNGLKTNGKFIRSQNKVLIRSDLSAVQMYVEVFKHEFMHRLETKQLYSKFFNFCFNKSKAFEQYVRTELKTAGVDVDAATREGVLQAYTNYKYEQYKNSRDIPKVDRDAFTKENAQEEIIADFFAQILFQGKKYRARIIEALQNADGEMLIGIGDEASSKAALMELQQKEPTLFEQVIEWFKDVINKLRGLPQAKSLVEQLDNEINLLESMARRVYWAKDSKLISEIEFVQEKYSVKNTQLNSNKYWYPNMTKAEIELVKRIAKREINTTDNYIDNENKWLYNKFGDKTYFALYSTEDINEPTVLYACKGDRAEFEYWYFINKWFEKEVQGNGTIYTKSGVIERLSKSGGNSSSGRIAHISNVVGRGSDTGDARLYIRNTRRRPSEALRDCLRNIREIQERDGRGLGRRLNNSQYSLGSPIQELKYSGEFELSVSAIGDIEISEETKFLDGLGGENLNKSQLHIVDICKKLDSNVTVEFVDKLEGNGKLIRSQNKILIRSDLSAVQMYVEVFKHEFMHRLETKQLYSKFFNFCFNKSKAFEQYVRTELKTAGVDVDAATREGVLQAYTNYKYEQYKNSRDIPKVDRDAFTKENAQEEIIADFFAQILFQGKKYRARIIEALQNADGEMLIGIGDEVSSEAALMELQEKEPTLFEQVIEWFKDVINKLRGLPQAKSLVEQLDNEINLLESMARRAYQSKDSKRLMREKQNNIKYSIKKSVDGQYYVEVENNIIVEKNDGKNIAKILSDIVKIKFKDFINVSGQKIGLNGKTVREWQYSKDAQYLLANSKQAYIDKLNAFNNADELLIIAKNYVSEAIKHERKDNFVEFARGTVDFKVSNRGYSADVIVGTTKSNVTLLYDIVGLQKKVIEEASHTAQDRRAETTSINNIISTNNEFVNNEDSKHLMKKKLGEVRYSTEKSFAEQVEDVINGVHNPRYDLYISETPKYLIDLNFIEGPLLMRNSKISEILEKHSEISKDTIKSLPEAMEEPMLILKSKTHPTDSVVVITDIMTDKGEMIVPVWVNQEGSYIDIELGQINMNTNFIASSYGRDIKKLLEYANDNDGFLYQNPNTERVRKLLARNGLQLPTPLKLSDSDIIVPQMIQSVNMNSMQETDKYSITSAYINKKDTFSDVLMSNDPKRYVQDEHQPNVSKNSVSHLIQKVKEDSLIDDKKHEGMARRAYQSKDSKRLMKKKLTDGNENKHLVNKQKPKNNTSGYEDFDKPITVDDVAVLRSIGKKSINNFSSDDIEKAQKWAYKFHRELGVKSPFFRAWFGDWRAYDNKEVDIVDTKSDNRSEVKNIDTGWNIFCSRKVNKETSNQSGSTQKNAVKYLKYIDDITKKAVLLDSVVSNKDNQNSLMFHSMYAYTEVLGYPALLKLRVEELYSHSDSSSEIFKRDYILQSIEEESVSESNRLSKPNQSETNSSVISISDLFELVKKYDKNFNPIPVNKEMLNSDGTPKLFFHQTDEDFDEFDTKRKGAGASDNETPYGVFLKESDRDIGLKGKKQMALFARMINPLVVLDRAQLVQKAKELSSEYAELYDKSKEIDKEYSKKHEAAIKAFNDFIIRNSESENRKTREELYKDPEFLKVWEAEDNIVDEWQQVNRENDAKAKEALTKALKDNGYDGVILKSDTGSFGRSTEAYIALDNTQVKSAIDNIGTFDGNNSNIKYSLGSPIQQMRYNPEAYAKHLNRKYQSKADSETVAKKIKQIVAQDNKSAKAQEDTRQKVYDREGNLVGELTLKERLISEREQKYIQTLCDKLGRAVVFEDLREMRYKGEIISPDGYIENGVIHLNLFTQNPIGFVFKHELTHFAEKAKGYFDFVKQVKRSSLYQKWLAEKTGESDIRIAEYKYKQMVANTHGDISNVSNPKAEAEMTADFVGEMLFTENGSGMVSLASDLEVKHRNAVVRFVLDFISYIKKKLSGISGMTLELSRLEDRFNELLSDAKNNGVYDGEIKFSIKVIFGNSGKNYGVGVYLDSNLLTGLTETERKQMLKEFVVSELAGEHFIAYDNNSNAVDIQIASNSMIFKNQKGQRRQVLKELYNKYNRFIVKQEAIVLIDELIASAKYTSSLAPKYSHDWLDNYGKNDWEYWKVFIQEKNKAVWEATLNIANTTNGEKILYDIDPIKKVEGPVKSGPTTTFKVEQAIESATSTTINSILQNNKTSQELLLSNPDNYEIEIVRKQPARSATQEKHPNTSSKLLSDNIILDTEENVNDNRKQPTRSAIGKKRPNTSSKLLSDNSVSDFNKNVNKKQEVLSSEEVAFFVPIGNRGKTNMQITEQEQKYIQTLCDKLGRTVVFEDLREMYYKGKIISPDGYIENGVIHLNLYAQNPIGFVFKHEFTHFAEKAKGYTEFVRQVKCSSLYQKWLAEKTGESDVRIAEYKYKQQVARTYNDIYSASDPKADAELIADFVGEMLFTENGSGMASIVSDIEVKHRNKVVQFVLDLISYLKKKLSGLNGMTLQLSVLEDSFNRVVSEATELENKGLYKYDDGTSFCFVPCTDKQLINKAEELESQGYDCLYIFEKCNLLRDAYGKWKYELNTGEFEFYADANARTERHYFNNKLQKPDGSFEGKLNDFISFKSLFEIFPQLKDITVIEKYWPGDTVRLVIDSKSKKPILFINKELSDAHKAKKAYEVKPYILRELQKAIQRITGEYIGKSLNYWENMEKEGRTPYSNRLGRKLTADEAHKYTADNYEAETVWKRRWLRDNLTRIYADKGITLDTIDKVYLYAPRHDMDMNILFDENDNPVIVKEYSISSKAERNIPRSKNILAYTQDSKQQNDNLILENNDEEINKEKDINSFEAALKENKNSNELRHFLVAARMIDKKDITQNLNIRAGSDSLISNVADNAMLAAEYFNQDKIKELSQKELQHIDSIGRVLSENLSEKFKNTIFKNEKGQLNSLYTLKMWGIGGFEHSKLGLVAGTLEAAKQLYTQYNEGSSKNRDVYIQELYVDMKNPLVLHYTPYEDSIHGIHDLVEREIFYHSKFVDLINSKNAAKEATYSGLTNRKIRDAIKEAGYDGIIYFNDSTDKGSMTVLVFDENQMVTVAENGKLRQNNGITEDYFDLAAAEDAAEKVNNDKNIKLYVADSKYKKRKYRPVPDERIMAGGSGFMEKITNGVANARKALEESLAGKSEIALSGKDIVGRRLQEKITSECDKTFFKNESGDLLSFFAYDKKIIDLEKAIKSRTLFGTLNSALNDFVLSKEKSPRSLAGAIQEFYINSVSPLIVELDKLDAEAMAKLIFEDGIITEKEYYRIISPERKNPALVLINKLIAKGFDSIVFVKQTGEYAVLPFNKSQVFPVADNGIVKDNGIAIQDYEIEEHNENYNIDYVVIERERETPIDTQEIRKILLLECDNTTKLKLITKVLMCNNNPIINYTDNRTAGNSGMLEKNKVDIHNARAIVKALINRDFSNISIADTDTAGRIISEYKRKLLHESKLIDKYGRPLSVFIFNRYGDYRFEHSQLGLRVSTLNAAHKILLLERENSAGYIGGFFEEYYPIVKNPYFIMFDPQNLTPATLAKYLLEEGTITNREYHWVLSIHGAHETTYNSRASNRMIQILKEKGFDCLAFMNERFDPGSIGLIIFDKSQLIPVAIDGLPVENSDRTLADSENEPAFLMPENDGENFVGNSQFENVENINENGIIEETVDNDLGVPGEYTYEIVWQGRKVPARRDGKGHRGPRTKQHNERVNNYELKLNPDNESYFLDHPDGNTVQFENMKNGIVQDCKLVMDKYSIYYVKEKISVLNKNILKQANRQLEAANSVGYKVEWLVSDQKAVDQMIELFNENNLDIIVTYYPE